MKGIKRNRILVWLMYFIAFFCMGYSALICWTVYQLMKYNKEKEEYINRQIPIKERKEIIDLNKDENLTDEEKMFLKSNPGFVKIKKGVYLLESK